MSLTVSQGEGLTVITIASDPKSKWPVLCQVLSFLCCSPVCSVSQNLKKKLTNIHTALGIMQIIVGVINIMFGILLKSSGEQNHMTEYGVVFWIGGVVLVTGIVTVLASKFPSPFLLVIAVILNVVSAALAITAVVLCSMDLATRYRMEMYNSYISSYDFDATPSPEEMIVKGLDIMMIVLSVLQLCVTISICVLTGKALCKKDKDGKSVEDPEVHKPLLEDATPGAAC